MIETLTKSKFICKHLLPFALALWVVAAPNPVLAQSAPRLPQPAIDVRADSNTTKEVAILAGGCFWGVQGVFQHVQGVSRVVSGYAGGNADTAYFEIVGTGSTGHAESVRIEFDPRQISYGKILQIYFSVAHDPTELNRQGPDVGTQYRSTIFPVSKTQERVASAYIDQLAKAHAFAKPIATTIETDKQFYEAEDYHQDFLTLHPTHPYIVFNDLPKIADLKASYPDFYRADPVLVSQAK